jgi:hypothetical protein
MWDLGYKIKTIFITLKITQISYLCCCLSPIKKWMCSPLYTNSTKSEAFRRSFGMKTILDFWLPTNATYIIQDVRPLLKVGVT